MIKTASDPPPRLVITMGDPLGIGPEIIVKAIDLIGPGLNAELIIIAAPHPLELAARTSPRRSTWRKIIAAAGQTPGRARTGPSVRLVPIADFASPVRSRAAGDPARASAAAGRAAWDCLELALDLIRQGRADAIVTAPVNKANLIAAGFGHPGHTGWLQAQTGRPAVMMLAAGALRVVPVTTHVPLAAVPRLLTPKLILDTLRVLDAQLKARFRIPRPRLAVSALNPHAGEQGLIGDEEDRVIRPALEAARRLGLNADGPFPADALFTPDRRRAHHAIVLMYHDQAMIPIKALARDRAVNVTLGLPFVRTSPAHGVAADIAGQNRADPRSMAAALKLARKLAAAKPAAR